MMGPVSARLRPRFELRVAADTEEVMRRMREALDQPDAACRGGVSRKHIELKVNAKDSHYWSPCLSLEVEPERDGHVVLRGRFGPHPNVWTLFFAIYATLCFIVIGALVLGWSQYIVQGSAPALMVAPVALVLWALTYAGALFGQSLGHDQIAGLSEFVHTTLAVSNADEEARETPGRSDAAGPVEPMVG